MSSLTCIVGWVPALSKQSGRLLVSARQSSHLYASVQKGFRRGVKSAAASADVVRDEEEEDQSFAEEERIRKIRDISGLRPEHRCVVNEMPSEDGPRMPWHYTVLWHKRMFGRFGYESGVNPSICWPTKAQLEDTKEYESLAYPYSIMEVADRERAKRELAEKQRIERDAQVAANVDKMLKLKVEYMQRKEKQKQEAEAAKAFKLRLIEEVRLHFNYSVSERDDKFRNELKERAKLLKDREKNAKKMSKKEKQAQTQAIQFDKMKERLRMEEAKRAASKIAQSKNDEE